jgi:S1-C subfamily serine protease
MDRPPHGYDRDRYQQEGAAGDPQPARHRRPTRTSWRRAGISVAVALTLTAGAGAIAVDALGATSAVTAGALDRHGGTGQGGSSGGMYGGGTYGGGSGQGGTGQSQQSDANPATAQQATGVVDVTTVLDYGNGEAAGTGIVLSSNGEILTNNHVVQGSTSITVTDVTSGKTYTGTVVGTDATDDVAVVQLKNASGLVPAALASPAAQAAVAPGTAVTAVGNAGGAGGTPSAASGSVLALGQTITASDETSANPENLAGLIEVGADVISGDSGGPLYANGSVIGMDTAASASSGPTFRAAADSTDQPSTGYAIPIDKALNIAGQITSGVDNSTIQQGYPAFLGVEVASNQTDSSSGSDGSGSSGGYGSGYGSESDGGASQVSGAPISGVLNGSPASSAGLAAGDVVTSIDGTSISTSDQLSSTLATHHVGEHVQLSWTEASGASHSATVTLAAGPAA